MPGDTAGGQKHKPSNKDCTDSLPTQTENRQKSEKDCVADRLWEMAEEKLHVSKTHTKPAQVSQLHALILHGVLVTGRNLLPLSWNKH